MRSTRHSWRTLSMQGIIPQGRGETHPIPHSVSPLEIGFVCPLQTDVFHLRKEQGIPSPPVQWSMTAELKHVNCNFSLLSKRLRHSLPASVYASHSPFLENAIHSADNPAS